MSLEAGQYIPAENFILCLNDLVPEGSTFAQAVAWLLTADGVVNTCLKEIIIECASGLEPGDVKEIIIACIEGPDSPIDKEFLAGVIQENG